MLRNDPLKGTAINISPPLNEDEYREVASDSATRLCRETSYGYWSRRPR